MSKKSGSTFRRCACRNPETGKQYGQSCPKFKQRRHGVWNLRQELPPKVVDDKEVRRVFRRGGYATAEDAQSDLDKIRALLNIPAKDDKEGQERIGDLLATVSAEKLPIPDLEETRTKFKGGIDLRSDMTVGDLLDAFLAQKEKTKRATTMHGYRSHVRAHLKPHLGHLRLDRLTVGAVQAMFDAIDDQNEVIVAENTARREQEARCKARTPGRPNWRERKRLLAERAKLEEMPPYRKTAGPATKQRIRATLHGALKLAIKTQLITFNAADHVELDPGKRPKALLWTDEHVARWRKTGEKPSGVMVWTPEQFGTFLDAAQDDRLYPLFHLVGHRGLRRGEAVGQDWAYVNLDAGELTPAKEIVQDGWTPYESDPKTEESASAIHLDGETVSVLRAWRAQQNRERLEWGEAWQDTGKVFTREDGSWLHPEMVSDAFRRICAKTDLPPINFRDLRHVAATLIHGAGGDIHTIKETLRHATIVLTSDTYTSLLPSLNREVAEKAANLVPRARKKAVGETDGLTPGSPASEEGNVLPLQRADGGAFPQVNGGESR
jgi:integrase